MKNIILELITALAVGCVITTSVFIKWVNIKVVGIMMLAIIWLAFFHIANNMKCKKRVDKEGKQ